MSKNAVLIPILLIFISAASFAREEIWIAPITEINRYSVSGVAAGGGISIGYGEGFAFGLRKLYNMAMDEVTTLELTVFLRLYFFDGHSGLFAQMNWGPALFFEEDYDMKWMLSASFGIGWRFLINDNWYVEPLVRGGFPFLVGAGVSLGFRF